MTVDFGKLRDLECDLAQYRRELQGLRNEIRVIIDAIRHFKQFMVDSEDPSILDPDDPSPNAKIDDLLDRLIEKCGAIRNIAGD